MWTNDPIGFPHNRYDPSLFTENWNLIGSERSAHPELVEQNAPGRVELVVADPLRDEVGGARVEERDPRRFVDELAIDARPEEVRGPRVGHLHAPGILDLLVDARTAEAWVIQGCVAREVAGDERPGRGVVREPGADADLPAARLAHDGQVRLGVLHDPDGGVEAEQAEPACRRGRE